MVIDTFLDSMEDIGKIRYRDPKSSFMTFDGIQKPTSSYRTPMCDTVLFLPLLSLLVTTDKSFTKESPWDFILALLLATPNVS